MSLLIFAIIVLVVAAQIAERERAVELTTISPSGNSLRWRRDGGAAPSSVASAATGSEALGAGWARSA